MTDKHKKRSRTTLFLELLMIALFLLIAVSCAVAVLSPKMAAKQEEDLIQQEISTWQERIVIPPETQPADASQTEARENSQAEKRPYNDLYEDMVSYNAEIYENGQKNLQDTWSYEKSVFDLSSYGLDSEIAAVVTIPKLGVEMPLYLGATRYHLSEGFAQLTETSAPIGGENTNCVIAGHRGWNSMKYLIDIEQLEIDDEIIIQNLWETLYYKVCDIQIINPDQVEKIHIQEGRDLVTLLTCHPYRVNTYRYIVTAERFEPENDAAELPPEQTQSVGIHWGNRVTIKSSDGIDFQSSQKLIFLYNQLPTICVILSFILLIAAIIIVLVRYYKSNREKTD